ncbi:hypothetical protein C0Q70_11825 [Pomacea canaliculata]|uniref:Uncharacterized protein n=1 Tax=Pomacea canaliculata TaxID=400727 RepID=A0A2T7P726_POMCA|nr:hypothetical protein C0Q70_11825 [Pomacea canaliculata]
MNLFDPSEAQKGPEVVIDTWKWKWTVGRKLLPVTVFHPSNTFTVNITRPDDVMFGQTWLALEGSLLHVECNYTSQPRPLLITEYSESGPQALPSQKSGNFFPHIAGGVLVASCLVAALVVVGVAKVWRQQSARARKVCIQWPAGRRQEGRATQHFVSEEGEYCQIGDKVEESRECSLRSKKLASTEGQYHVEMDRISNPNLAHHYEHQEENCGDCDTPTSSQSLCRNSRPLQTEGKVKDGKTSSGREGNRSRKVSGGGAATEAAIYDHAGKVVLGDNSNDDNDGVYDRLQRGSARVVIIVNIYDTTR